MEEGTYQELLKKQGGKFAGLAKNQILKEVEGETIKINEKTEENDNFDVLSENNHAIRASFHSLKINKSHKKSVGCVDNNILTTSSAVVVEKTDEEKKREKAE